MAVQPHPPACGLGAARICRGSADRVADRGADVFRAKHHAGEPLRRAGRATGAWPGLGASPGVAREEGPLNRLKGGNRVMYDVDEQAAGGRSKRGRRLMISTCYLLVWPGFHRRGMVHALSDVLKPKHIYEFFSRSAVEKGHVYRAQGRVSALDISEDLTHIRAKVREKGACQQYSVSIFDWISAATGSTHAANAVARRRPTASMWPRPCSSSSRGNRSRPIWRGRASRRLRCPKPRSRCPTKSISGS